MKYLWVLIAIVFSCTYAEDFTRFGYYRVGAVSPMLHIASPELNTEEILKELEIAETKNVSVVLFPEIPLTGYTAEDLFFQDDLLMRTKKPFLN